MRKYDKQFRQSVLDYVHKHEELTVYECSKVFGMGYSTLNRWLREERGEKVESTKEQPMLFNDDDRKEIVKLQQELHEARKTLKVLKDAFELLGR